MRSTWILRADRLSFRLYVAGLTLIGIALFLFSFFATRDTATLTTFAVVSVVLVGGEYIGFPIADVYHTLAAPAQIAACVLLPPPGALALSVLSVLIIQFLRPPKRAWDVRAFNLAHTAINVGASGIAYAHVARVGAASSVIDTLTHPLATLLLIATFLVCDAPLLHIALWCLRRGAYRVTLHTLWEDNLPELAALPIGLLAAILYQVAPPATLLLVVPLILLTIAFKASDRYVQEQAARAAADVRAEEQERRARLLEEVARFGQAANLTDTGALLAAIARSVATVSGAASVEVRVAAHAGLPAASVSSHAADTADGARMALSETHELTGGEQDPVGVITLRGRPQESDPTRDAVLAILLGQVALALANDALHRDALHRATTDALTMLHNRAGGLAHIERLIAQARRSGAALSLLQLDLDGFKAINDTWGHEAGDVALVAVAGALRATCRTSDVPIRLGGDEFLVVLADTDLTAGREVADRLCTALNPLRFDYMGRTLTVGASLGIVAWEVGMDDDGLLRAADEAAYAAKKQGKGRVATSADAHALVGVSVSVRDRRPIAGMAT